MARKEQTLTCTFFVGGKQVEKLTPDQTERMAQRLTETMSLYYTAHPEEYSQLETNSNPTQN